MTMQERQDTQSNNLNVDRPDFKIPELPMYTQAIRQCLPHHYPFLLVDRVTEIEVNRIRGYKNLTINEEFFQGHFPKYPLMPGVLMMEALAQLSGILGVVILQNEDTQGETFLFAGMENVRFKRQVVPGDQLQLDAELIMSKRGIFKFKCSASVDGKIASQADIILARQALNV